MNKKDKQIIKESAMVVADQIASNLPGLNIAWGLSKALYGAGLKLREQRALEWVEMVRDNPSVFAEDILKDTAFQDGFVYALENFIKERSGKKRDIMKKVFLDYARSTDRENFELERFYGVLDLLNYEDIRVLRDIDTEREDFHQVYEGTKDKNENIYNLVNVGILMSDYSSRIGPIAAPFIKITRFGNAFVRHLTDKEICPNK